MCSLSIFWKDYKFKDTTVVLKNSKFQKKHPNSNRQIPSQNFGRDLEFGASLLYGFWDLPYF
jgi:hypothetical protein